MPKGPALKLQPLPLFMVSPINSIIHLLFLAIGTFIFKQTKENIKSPHGNMFFSCASFSLAWCFVKRLVKITDDIKRPGVEGQLCPISSEL